MARTNRKTWSAGNWREARKGRANYAALSLDELTVAWTPRSGRPGSLIGGGEYRDERTVSGRPSRARRIARERRARKRSERQVARLDMYCNPDA